MDSQSNNTRQEVKNHSADNEVAVATPNKTVENKETTTKESNDKAPAESSSSTTTTKTMPDDSKGEETAESKARFRKSNLFINTEEANAFFNKKK
ncbi:hypothetical protein KCU98_g524, partial [Aureobasidium melanogenum]